MEAPDSILAIDIGNSSIHAGCFVDIPTMTGGRQPPLPAPVVSQAWTSEGPVPNDPMPPNAVTMNTVWVVASVNRAGLQRVRQWHDSVAPSCPFIVLARDAFSLAIDVRHPDRVGIDRLAAATAANRLRPKGRSAVVVDAGTAITVDALDSRGCFLGGAILPGVGLMARSLSTWTDQLPLVECDLGNQSAPAIGKQTVEAIRGGITWGIRGAVRALAQQIQTELGDTESPIFVTGGSGRHLTSGWPSATFIPQLTLAGVVIAYLETASRPGT